MLKRAYTINEEFLELRDLENIWIEIANNHNHILFGLFYRPPNANAYYFSNIEDSIALAVDTNSKDIIVTGDFNFNVINQEASRKIYALCTQYNLFQYIERATYFTETSSSLIDIVLVSNKDHLILSGVGEPFLNQDIRYHCPIYGMFKFTKTKSKTFKRHIWNYEHNYELLRQKASSFDWNSLHDEDIDI